MKAWRYAAGLTARTLVGNLEASISMNSHVTPPDATNLQRGQVLIQVVSAALNHVDYKLPEADCFMKRLAGLATDSQPGVDFSGRVLAVHPSCEKFTEGQRVCGTLARPSRWSALGQLLVASTTEVFALPDEVTFDDAAALGLAAGTAFQALEGLTAGAHVFVNGGSGGVGTFVVQLAKLLGAGQVTATCSEKNMQMVKSLGADTVIDYRSVPDLVAELENNGLFDLIIDAVGSTTSLYAQSHRIVQPRGTFVQVAAQPSTRGMVPILKSTMQSKLKGPPFSFVVSTTSRQGFTQMLEWMRVGALQSTIGRRFEFEDVGEAYAQLRQGTSGGRVVVHVASS